MKKKTVGYLAIAGALSFGIIEESVFRHSRQQILQQLSKRQNSEKDLDAATKQKVKRLWTIQRNSYRS